MIHWSDLLRGIGQRADLQEAFAPDLTDTHQPALLNTMPTLNAAFVAARVLYVISKRGGTKVKSPHLERLTAILEKALPEEVQHHCDEEARRILDWLEFPPTPKKDDEIPELEVMHAGDIASRVATTDYALQEGYDLELEYYDPERKIWPRLRATPLRIEHPEDEPSFVVVEHASGKAEITFENIRWLMPVRRLKRATHPDARVLQFPGTTDSP